MNYAENLINLPSLIFFWVLWDFYVTAIDIDNNNWNVKLLFFLRPTRYIKNKLLGLKWLYVLLP